MKAEFVEIVEVEPWLFRVRSSTNRRKWYDIIWRRDETFSCNCAGFRFNGENDKHINAVRAMVV